MHLAKNRVAVDLFLEAAKKPQLGYVPRDAINNGWLQKSKQGIADQVFAKRPRQEIVLPEISEFRAAKTLLAGSAFAAAAAGDMARALECQAAIVRMAQHLWGDQEFVICRVVALGIFGSAASTLSNLLARTVIPGRTTNCSVDASRCDRGTRTGRTSCLATSRESSRQLLIDMYSTDGRFTREGFETVCLHSLQTPQLAWLAKLVQPKLSRNNELIRALVGPCVVPLVASREEVRQEFDALSDLYEAELQSAAQWELGFRRLRTEMAGVAVAYPTSVKYLPLLIDVRNTWAKVMIEGSWKKVTERDAVLVAIACQLYHRRHDAWPESVQVLAPEFLEEVPLDPIDSQPLRLVMIKDRPFVYSVGLDHKNATAGTPPREAQ